MSIAGLFVALGVILMGSRVIRTIGTDLAAVDFHFGYSVELASVLTVTLATVEGLPVSSTHCQVGAVVFLGVLKGRRGEGNGANWRLFGKIALSWALTLPFAGGLAAILTFIFRDGLRSGGVEGVSEGVCVALNESFLLC